MARYIINNVQAAIDFEVDEYSTARILQNCKNLLRCFRGEVPYARYKGFDRQLMDMPIEQLNEILVEQLDLVMAYEPRATVVSASATLDEKHETVITCELEIDDEEG